MMAFASEAFSAMKSLMFFLRSFVLFYNIYGRYALNI